MTDPHADPLADLARTWADQPTKKETGLMAAPATTIASEMMSAYKKDRRRMIWLSVQEGVPAIGLAAFVLIAIVPEAKLVWLAVLCGIIPLGVVGYAIATSVAQERRATQFGTSTKAVIEQRLDQVTHRASMYRNIFWWYLLPLGVMLVLLIVSVDGAFPTDREALVIFGAFGAVSAVLYAMNRLTGKVKYDAEQERLRRMLDELSS